MIAKIAFVLAVVVATFCNAAPVPEPPKSADGLLDPSEVQRYLEASKNYDGFVNYLHLLPKDVAEKYAAAVAKNGIEKAAGAPAEVDEVDVDEANNQDDDNNNDDDEEQAVQNDDDNNNEEEASDDENTEDEETVEADDQQENVEETADPEEVQDQDQDQDADQEVTEEDDEPTEDNNDEEEAPSDDEEVVDEETDDDDEGDEAEDDQQTTTTTASPSVKSSTKAAITSTTQAQQQTQTPPAIPIGDIKVQLDKWFRDQLQRKDTNPIDVLNRMLYYISSNRLPADQQQKVMALLADVEPKMFDLLINLEQNPENKANLQKVVDKIANQKQEQPKSNINNNNNKKVEIFQQHN